MYKLKKYLIYLVIIHLLLPATSPIFTTFTNKEATVDTFHSTSPYHEGTIDSLQPFLITHS
jgi:hypothetical protein